MVPIDAGSTREFLEALIAGFSVLGGVMAYFSGYAAHGALPKISHLQPSPRAINEGLGIGFELGSGLRSWLL